MLTTCVGQSLVNRNRWCSVLTTCVGQSLVNQTGIGGVVCSPRVWVKALLIRQNRWCSVLTTCVGQSLVNQTESVV